MMVSLTMTRKNNNSYNNKNKSKNNKTIKMINHLNQKHLFYRLMVIFMRY